MGGLRGGGDLVRHGLRRPGEAGPGPVRGGRGRGEDPGQHGGDGGVHAQAEGHHGHLHPDLPDYDLRRHPL